MFTWNSQPFVKSQPAGNILLSASILFSGSTTNEGSSCTQEYGMCHHCRAHSIFNTKASFYIFLFRQSGRSINQGFSPNCVGKSDILLLVETAGRADSPGHSAKFGSYTVMELKKGVVLDIQLVQVSTHPLQSLCN